jgi:plasmid stability protein
MASITIRKLSDETKRRLRIRAAQRGRSMEEEAREILQTTLAAEPQPPKNLAIAIVERFARLGGVDLPIPEREPMRDPIDLGQ